MLVLRSVQLMLVTAVHEQPGHPMIIAMLGFMPVIHSVERFRQASGGGRRPEDQDAGCKGEGAGASGHVPTVSRSRGCVKEPDASGTSVEGHDGYHSATWGSVPRRIQQVRCGAMPH